MKHTYTRNIFSRLSYSGYFSLVLILAIFPLVTSIQAQTSSNAPPLSDNFAAAGISYNRGASPAIAGTAVYARLVSRDLGTYSFNVIDALPMSTKPFTVNTAIATGVAQRVIAFKDVSFYIPIAAGVSWTGSNAGWSWTTGGIASIRVGKEGRYRVMPNIRLVKSNLGQGTYQVVTGVMFGAGW